MEERIGEYVMRVEEVLRVGRLLFRSGKERDMRQGEVESRFSSGRVEMECSLVCKTKNLSRRACINATNICIFQS